MVNLEYCEHPDNAEGTGAEEGDYHRHNGIAETADRADHNVHHTAEEIERRAYCKTVQTILDNLCIRAVKAEKMITHEICAVAKNKTDYNLFLSMVFRLEDSYAYQFKLDCNRLYGSMIITPEKVHENIDALINILEMLDADLNNPNAYLRMNELNNLLEHGE